MNIKKAKGVNKNFVARISDSEYKNVLFKYKCLRHLMNRIQSKNHETGTYIVNKISLSCFDDKIYILNSYQLLLSRANSSWIRSW